MSLNAEPRPTGASDKVNSSGWSWTQWQSDSWPSHMYSEGFLSFSVAFICFYTISRGLFDLDLVQTWSCNRARSCKSCPHLLRKCCVPKLLDARLPHLMIGSWFWRGCGTTEKTLGFAWVPSQSSGSSQISESVLCQGPVPVQMPQILKLVPFVSWPQKLKMWICGRTFWGCNNKSKIWLCILCHMLIGFNGSFSPLFCKAFSHVARPWCTMPPNLGGLCWPQRPQKLQPLFPLTLLRTCRRRGTCHTQTPCLRRYVLHAKC